MSSATSRFALTRGDPVQLTSFRAKILGPVLALRAISILIGRRHLVELLQGLDREITTITFSLFPIALVMGCMVLASGHTDRLSPAAILIQ